MLAEIYAKAVYEVTRSGKPLPEALSGLQAVLKQRGHQKLLRTIYNKLLLLAESDSESQAPVVTVAQKGDIEMLQEDIEKALSKLDATAEHRVVEDESIIGGFTLRSGHRYVDQSHKGALVALYRNITS